ncbi:MAG TPA: hypothetical protein P5076_21290, partial [Myxococcota bacterium]|nr:hypothetical protein [Myxococcota bacterium]
MRALWTAILVGVIGVGCGGTVEVARPDPAPTATAAEPVAVAPAPPADQDRDGIADAQDACPKVAEDLDGHRDLDGCPDPDNDRDGIVDAQDRCPGDPETRNDFEDLDGCPDVAPGGKVAAVQPDGNQGGQMDPNLLAGLGDGPALDSKNQPTSIRAIKARPVGELPPEPGPEPRAEVAPPPRRVAGGPAPVVAVFDIQDASRMLPRAEDRDQLTEYLAAQLTELAGFRVVPRDQLRARLQQQKTVGYQQCYDQSCQIELGKAMAAEKSLSTKLLKV